MRRITLFASTALLLLTQSALAATLIEIKDGEGGHQKIWIEGHKMRIEQTNEPGFVLFDGKGGHLYVVDPEERHVVDMSGMTKPKGHAAGKAAPLKIELTRKGSGPTIAGYPTKHYVLKVNGKKCGDEYLSSKALKDVGGLEIFDALDGMTANATMGMPEEMKDPCDMQGARLKATYQKHGYPLRVVNPDGTLDMEVLRITKKAPPPAGGFKVPAGYEVVDFDKMMREAMQPREMPESREHADERREPPDSETMERMMKEMMKQMQRR